MIYAQLVATFAKIGLLGFGGGPSFVPLLQREVVDARGWLSKEQFIDAFAFGNALPGPITTKLAGYVGHRIGGWPGAAAALIGLAGPTIVAMILLATAYVAYQDHPLVESFLVGVRPVVIALLMVVVLNFAPRALGRIEGWRTHWGLWLLAAMAFVLAALADIHPAALIVAGGVVGVTLLRRI